MEGGRRRVPVADKTLSARECETILKALSSYQIHLYDKMKGNESLIQSDFIKLEADLVTSAIKKIHSIMEEVLDHK